MLTMYKKSNTSFFTATIHTWSPSEGLMHPCFLLQAPVFLGQENNKLYFFLFEQIIL